MSSTNHAVHPGESFTPLGYNPFFTPASQVDRLTGKTARTCGRRRNPNVGSCSIFISPQLAAREIRASCATITTQPKSLTTGISEVILEFSELFRGAA
jgi:hypothetical protein